MMIYEDPSELISITISNSAVISGGERTAMDYYALLHRVARTLITLKRTNLPTSSFRRQILKIKKDKFSKK